ncbi:MAG: T9SS type A sorting domain-containing protein [Candidatus Eisenbacteria bacterium]|nr:T9SS type A sorting domain-containing protein [Candidatus Eisenbacteria bacterium]
MITRAVSHVAVPPSANGAVDLNVTYFNGVGVRYKPLSDQALPVALGYTAGPRTSLPGPHPELGMAICGGDAALQELRLVQSQALTDVVMDSSHAQMAQGFQVPRACRLHWVELALMSPLNGYAPGELAIFDGDDVNPLLTTTGPALASASFQSAPGGPSWVSHFDFDTSLVLQPHHDYWLVVAPANIYKLGAHARTGAEGTDFEQGIRSFWTRSTTFGTWVEQTGRALSFKLIGDTTTAVGVGVSEPAHRALQLAASPNPARGAATLTWNGAVGAVRIEVLDARGRRVASHAGGANGAGQWTWSMAGAGNPLPAGLYFVRATDSQGQAAVARVAVIR